MKYSFKKAFTGLLLAVISSGTLASDELRYNPFEQPDLMFVHPAVNGKGPTSGVMELRGMLIDGNASMVNIDGQYYRVNEEVSGYRVLRIANGSVTLQRGENELILTFKNEN